MTHLRDKRMETIEEKVRDRHKGIKIYLIGVPKKRKERMRMKKYLKR